MAAIKEYSQPQSPTLSPVFDSNAVVTRCSVIKEKYGLSKEKTTQQKNGSRSKWENETFRSEKYVSDKNHWIGLEGG